MKLSIKENVLVKFLVFSGLTYLILYLIHQFIVKRYTYYDQEFIGHIIKGTDFVLQTLGYNTFLVLQDSDFQVIGIDGSNGVWVGSNCNAISLFTLFSVFIFWYPGQKKDKWWFILLGIISIHLVNIIRVVALTLIAKYSPENLDFNHTYTFTFFVYGYIFLLWVWWVNSFANKTQKVDEN
ncbi:MAG: archaeosortase/exosortase family protein [Bacteroidia bacterium]